MRALDPNSWSWRLRQERITHNWRQQDLADRLGTTVLSVKRWERGSHQPSQYFRAKLCTLFEKDVEALGLVPRRPGPPNESALYAPQSVEALSILAPSPISWYVPYPRNPLFTGREEVLSQLHGQLQRKQSSAPPQWFALNGLGGIGKTQIALEYVYRYRQNYAFVFWTRATTRETFLADLANIADCLHLPGREEQNQDGMLHLVKQWLATHDGWLWILDHVDDLAIIASVLPTDPTGYLLLTTRLQALGALAQHLEVETMGLAEATLFLLRRTGLLACDAWLETSLIPEEHLAAAEALALELGLLPLALDQAGAYMEEVGCSIAGYLERYRTRRQELLQRRGQFSGEHSQSVTTTWSLSLENVERANPAAAELLRLCAFLEPDFIPEELLSEGSAHLGPILGSVAADALKLDKAFQELRRYSLIRRDSETKHVQIHSLLQVALKERMGRKEQLLWAERAVRATNEAFPALIEKATSKRCQRLLAQAQACSVLIRDYVLLFGEAAALLSRTATCLREYALDEQAEQLRDLQEGNS